MKKLKKIGRIQEGTIVDPIHKLSWYEKFLSDRNNRSSISSRSHESQKNELFQDLRGTTNGGKFCVLKITQRETKMVSDGNKFYYNRSYLREPIEWMTILYLKKFIEEYNFKVDTMCESELHKVYKYPKY